MAADINLYLANGEGAAMKSDQQTMLKLLKKARPGTPLPADGPCGSLYTHQSSPGEPIIVQSGSGYELVHIDYDDSLDGISWKRYGWNIETGGGRTAITLLIPQEDAPYTIRISLHHSIEENMRFLRYLQSKRKIDIHVVSILHGELVKSSSHVFTMPKETARTILGS